VAHILPSLKIKRGRVLIGYGNPKAIEQSVRFVEADLNRMFKPDSLISEDEKKSYEFERAQFIKKYLDQADVLLDVHASSSPKSKSFLICETNAGNIARYLPFNLAVSGFDEFEPGGTDYYMNSIGKVGICVECGYLKNLKSEQIAEKSILAFLAAQGHIEKDLKVYKKSFIRIYDLYKTKTDNFSLIKEFKDFERVFKNQIIGLDGGDEVIVTRNGVILFARNRNNIGTEAFLLGEYEKTPHINERS
jgi:succinylglutamate desuccinylase